MRKSPLAFPIPLSATKIMGDFGPREMYRHNLSCHYTQTMNQMMKYIRENHQELEHFTIIKGYDNSRLSTVRAIRYRHISGFHSTVDVMSNIVHSTRCTVHGKPDIGIYTNYPLKRKYSGYTV